MRRARDDAEDDDDALSREHDPTRASRAAVSPDAAMVTVMSGKAKGLTRRMPGNVGGALRVGKAAENDLVLPDDTVSRRHLVLERREDGVWARDLDSRNGLRVGGAKVREARVAPGTSLLVGDVELVVGVGGEVAQIPPSEREQFGLAFGRSQAMRQIFGMLERVAASPATVLLLGETGTGKDVLARSIHQESARATAPFEVLDCGAVAGSLIESELFGHERGAFTGAISTRVGAFERAAGGTIFLDEIGELPLELQPKLLRVLEAREFRRVGGQTTLAADVRVIAATTQDLRALVDEGRFRQDLYYRLAVVSLAVPPLRQRPEDVAALAERMLRASGSSLRLTPETIARLSTYVWPGNARELRNVVERSAVISEAMGLKELLLVDFPPPMLPRGEPELEFGEGLSYRESRERFEGMFERQYVAWLARRHRGNVSAAARDVRMDRNYLTSLLKRHGVHIEGRPSAPPPRDAPEKPETK